MTKMQWFLPWMLLKQYWCKLSENGASVIKSSQLSKKWIFNNSDFYDILLFYFYDLEKIILGYKTFFGNNVFTDKISDN